ncbi:MAG: AAA family ATPase, partial [Chloroflexota bacterium]
RARDLAVQTGDTSQVYPLLYGKWTTHIVRSEPQEALQVGEQFLSLAQQQQPSDTGMLCIGQRLVGASYAFVGQFQSGRAHLEKAMDLYDPQVHEPLAFRFGQNPGATNQTNISWPLWALGYPDQALTMSEQAIAYSRQLDHANTLAYALFFTGTKTNQMAREVEQVSTYADTLVNFAETNNLGLWLAFATVMQGWVLVEKGQPETGVLQMRQGLEQVQATGAKICAPYLCSLLAEGYKVLGQHEAGLAAIEQGLTEIQTGGERYWEAELYRLRGEFQLGQSDKTEAEGSFHQAIAIAQQQAARSLELRATVSLARLWKTQGKASEAQTRLQEIYNWFNEGFETVDLNTAKALLDTFLSTELSATDVKPQDTHSQIRHNLPPQPTPFIGREDELAELNHLIADMNTRLVTVVGPGGMGKTRLAVAFGERLVKGQQSFLPPSTPPARGEAHVPLPAGGRNPQQPKQIVSSTGLGKLFPNGIHFIPLAPLSAIDHIIPTLAEALDFPLDAGGQQTRTPQQQILDYLREKQMLLVMDNFEHLLDGVDLLAEILQTAHGVKILVTSRERLHLHEEQIFAIQGLEFPDWETPEDAAEYTAVKLFIQSAQRVKHGFQLQTDDLTYLTRICRLVEGLPLGVELAAAWVDMLSVEDIVTEIQKSLDFLETEVRNVPQRHRSIRAVFDASWQQMSEAEREVFPQLSIFRGGFTRQAAQEITGASLRLLGTLASKSLLQFNQTRGRYQIHELLRQYGAERLAEEQEKEAQVRDQHSRYYCIALQRRENDLKGARHQEALAEIEADIENVRLAWQWALTQNQIEWIAQGMSSLGHFYERQGRYEEGCQAFAQISEALANDPEMESKKTGILALAWYSRLLHISGQAEEAETQLKQLLDQLNQQPRFEQDTKSVKAFILLQLGRSVVQLKGGAIATEYYKESLSLYQELDDRWATAGVLAELGWAAYEVSNYQDSNSAYQEALPLYRTLEYQQGIAYVLEAMSLSARYQGKTEESKQLALECMAVCEKLGTLPDLVRAQANLAVALGPSEESEALLLRCVEIYTDLGAADLLANTRTRLAATQELQGKTAEARRHVELNLKSLDELDSPYQSGFALWLLGMIAIVEKNYSEAEQSLLQCIAICKSRDKLSYVGLANGVLGHSRLRVGQKAQAQQNFFEALYLGVTLPDHLTTINALSGIALIFAEANLPERAVELHAVCLQDSLYAKGKGYYGTLREALIAVAAALPPKKREAAITHGQTLDLAETAEVLLGELMALGWGGAA